MNIGILTPPPQICLILQKHCDLAFYIVTPQPFNYSHIGTLNCYGMLTSWMKVDVNEYSMYVEFNPCGINDDPRQFPSKRVMVSLQYNVPL